MRFYILFILAFLAQTTFSQTSTSNEEKKIFKVVDEMPRFPGCEVGIMTLEERKKCAEDNMLRYIYSNIQYPDSARIKGTQGRVVLQFVVEKTGLVSDAKILRDIGDGCGDEALRVVNLMREQNIYWRPGIKDSTAVDVQFTLPVNFKVQEYTPPPPYTIYNGDSIYLELEKAVAFKEGEEALKIFLATETNYPESGQDSCLMGAMKSDVIVRPNGSIQLLETIDFNNLGTDFLFEVIKLVPKTEGKWTPAIYEGKEVTSIYPLRIEFRPTSAGCQTKVDQYEMAAQKVEEAIKIHDEGNSAEALPLMDEAINIYPNNTEWLYFRGVMQISLQENEKACEDFQKIREILPVPWYEKWIDTVCKF